MLERLYAERRARNLFRKIMSVANILFLTPPPKHKDMKNQLSYKRIKDITESKNIANRIGGWGLNS